MANFVNVADFVDPDDPQGCTFREANAGKGHAIPLGALVEVLADGEAFDGVRMFVAVHGRDCDQTPLYWLSPCWPEDPNDLIRLGKRVGGFSDESLRVVRPSPAAGQVARGDLEALAARARETLELPPHPEGCDREIERGPERDVDGPLGPLCSVGTCDEPAVRAAVAFWSSSKPPLWDQVCERHRCDACRARALAADVLDLVARVRDLETPPAHDWSEAEAAALGFARDQRTRGGIIIPDSAIAAEVGKARRADRAAALRAERQRCIDRARALSKALQESARAMPGQSPTASNLAGEADGAELAARALEALPDA